MTVRASISPAPSNEHGADRTATLQSGHVAGQHHLGAEAGDLGDRPLRQIGAAQPLGEAEVVLDRRALAGLAAGRLALDHHGAQSLGRRVHRSGQSGRTAADDAHVVQRLLGAGVQPERAGHLEDPGRAERLAARHQHQRQIGRGGLGQVAQPLRLRVAFDVVPAVGDVVAGQEHLQVVAAVRPPVADHPHVGAVVRMGLLPVAEQVVEHGIEPLGRRVPRLHQVVVEADVVDRLDGHVGVGVRGQQHAAWRSGHGPAPVPTARSRSSSASADRRRSAPPARRAARSGRAARAPRRLRTRAARDTRSPYSLFRSRTIAASTCRSSSTARMVGLVIDQPRDDPILPDRDGAWRRPPTQHIGIVIRQGTFRIPRFPYISSRKRAPCPTPVRQFCSSTASGCMPAPGSPGSISSAKPDTSRWPRAGPVSPTASKPPARRPKRSPVTASMRSPRTSPPSPMVWRPSRS